MATIRCRDITIKYGSTTVIDHLDLRIEEGSFFVLLGPSGCGKTTLLRTIAGFITPASGQLFFDNADVTRIPAHKRNIGFVFQDHALFPNLTVFENIAYGLTARRIPKKEIAESVTALSAMVELEAFAHRYPAELSGGQRQRVALARALVIRPAVLLMDEPLSSLDTKLRIQMRAIISEIHRELGITTVWVTHDQEEALDLSTHMAVLNQGAVEQLGTPRQLYREPATAFVADFIGSANLIKLQSVHPTASDRLRCCLPCGQTLETQRGKDIDPDHNCRIMVVRPEELALPFEADRAGNQLAGQLLRKQYLGYKTTYLIKISDEQHLLVDDLGQSSENRPARGDTVFVTVPDKTRLVRS